MSRVRASTQHIAIASCDRLLPNGDPDDELLVRACRALGIDVSVRSWSDPSVDWDAYALTIIRSTWDYTDRRRQFLDWVQRTPRLHNPPSVIVANSDKLYLQQLIAAGIPTVPTEFAAPGDAVPLPAQGEFVLKPSIGAGSRGAARFDAALEATAEAALGHADQLHAAGRTVLVQPYLGDVDAAGETGLIFLDGVFSHAICKSAMLPRGSRHALGGAELFIAEQITARLPSAPELELAARVMQEYIAGITPSSGHESATPQQLLYARIDVLPTSEGPVVIEVELSEPSLFLAQHKPAAGVLAAAIAERIR